MIEGRGGPFTPHINYKNVAPTTNSAGAASGGDSGEDAVKLNEKERKGQAVFRADAGGSPVRAVKRPQNGFFGLFEAVFFCATSEVCNHLRQVFVA